MKVAGISKLDNDCIIAMIVALNSGTWNLSAEQMAKYDFHKAFLWFRGLAQLASDAIEKEGLTDQPVVAPNPASAGLAIKSYSPGKIPSSGSKRGK